MDTILLALKLIRRIAECLERKTKTSGQFMFCFNQNLDTSEESKFDLSIQNGRSSIRILSTRESRDYGGNKCAMHTVHICLQRGLTGVAFAIGAKYEGLACRPA